MTSDAKRTNSPKARQIPRGLAGFDLVREAGSGSTGTVYEASLRHPIRNIPTGTRVAVKFLHQHLVNVESARRRFLREARAGLNVKSSHLVRVYAVDEAEVLGSPVLYIVLEWIEGSNLRDLLKDGAVAEPLARSIGEQVARGLAALHSSGTVHLDIKPENVVLTPDGRAVVMDLGFARSMTAATESEIADNYTFAGSVAYASPERIRGLAPTPQSDIYSLGVLLYELVTGSLPFPGEDPSAIMHGHIALQPPAPSMLNSRVSPFLDALVGKCLAKNPAHRFASAEELAQIINKAELSTFWREKLAERTRTGAPGLRRAHLTTFQGREAELREIGTACARAAAGAFRVVQILGEPGMGKTRLVDQFVTSAQEAEDPPVSLYGRCRKIDDPPPAEAFVAMISRYLGVPSGVEPDAGAARRLKSLIPAGQATLIIDFLRGKRGESEIQKFGKAVADFMEALAREHSIVAFLDGADECDPATATVAAAVVEQQPPGACFIVGHRPNASRMDEVVEAARKAKLLTSIALAPLQPGEIAAVVDNLVEPGEERVALRDALVRVTGGNPGHLAEALRTLKASGVLVPSVDSTTSQSLKMARAIENFPIPQSLTDAIRARIDVLDPSDRQALSLVAVAGDRCDAELLIQAFGGDEITWLRTLSKLETIHSLLTSTAGTFRFARPIVREVIYDAFAVPERQRAHGAFAIALEKRLSPNARDRDRLRVAEHARRSTNIHLALKHLPALAEDFRRRGLFERALVLARSTVEMLNQLPRIQKPLLEARFDANVTIAEAASRLGNRVLERRCLEKCARIATYLHDTGRLARTLLSLGRLSYSTGRYLVASTYLERAIELSAQSGDSRTESEASLAKSIVVSYSGDPEQAGPLLARALDLARDHDLRARILLQMGLRWLNLDRPDLAMPQIEEALANFKELRMPAAQASAHFQLGRCRADIGLAVAARRDLDRALVLARGSGERRIEAMTLSLRGAIRAGHRDYEGAEKDLRASLSVADEIGDKFTECHSAIHLANTLLSSKNPKRNLREAARLARLALTLAEELALPRLRALAHAIRARAFMRASRLADAIAESNRALSVLDEGPRDRRRAAGVLFTHGTILKEAGRVGEARAFLSEAASIVKDSAARITDEKYRNAFLNDDPFHKKVLDAAAGS